MLIESGTEWTFNQSYEFKIMNSLSTPRSKVQEHTRTQYYIYKAIPIIAEEMIEKKL
jgi:hypothetical protein